jgi:peroxiredoxin
MGLHTISISVLLVVVVAAIPSFGQDNAEQSTSPAGENQQIPQIIRSRARVRAPSPVVEMPERLRPVNRAAEIEKDLNNLRAQIANLKSENTKLVAELEAIHKLALKENATKTAGRIEDFMTECRREFDERLQSLEQRQQRLQRIYGRQAEVMARIGRSGRKAPDFTLASFDDKRVSLSDYKGKIVVLEWFNLECPFCKYHYEKKNTMIELANKYKDKNVVWLAINSTSHARDVENKFFAQLYKLPYPILDDTSGDVGHAYGARTTPHMYVIDPNGIIVYQGAIDNAPLGRSQNGYENYVDKALTELIEGGDVSITYVKPYGCSVKYSQEEQSSLEK